MPKGNVIRRDALAVDWKIKRDEHGALASAVVRRPPAREAIRLEYRVSKFVIDRCRLDERSILFRAEFALGKDIEKVNRTKASDRDDWARNMMEKLGGPQA